MRREIIPDEEITKQVRQILVKKRLGPPCKILVETHKGVVTLSGTVPHVHLKERATQAAGGIDGCRDVVNQIEVQRLDAQWSEEKTR